MSKTITVSDEIYEPIKKQVEKVEIKTRIKNIKGEVIFESEKATFKEAVEEAISKFAQLERC